MTTTHAPSRACRLRGCQQEGCAQAHARYMKIYHLTRARHGTRRIPVELVAQRVDQLAESGWSHRQIAAAANCSVRTIASLVAREYPTIRRDIAHRILAAQPEISTLPGRTYVAATGTTRRVQALHAIGHDYKTIAAAAGVDDCALARVLNHAHEQVTARMAQGVRRAYEELSRIPGDSGRARLRAQRNGWRDPSYWDDVDRIDDPDFDPDRPLSRNELAAMRREEIVHLAWCGYQPEQIHDRLGGEITLSTIRAIVHEYRTGKRRDRSPKQVAA